MPLKNILALAAFLFLLPVPFAYAGDAAPSYVELKDAPTIVVDWSKGNTQSVTLGGNRTVTFSNGEKGKHYMLVIKQDATGSRTVTWPAAVRWPGGPPQTAGRPANILTTTANKTDYITFFYNGVSYDALGFVQNL